MSHRDTPHPWHKDNGIHTDDDDLALSNAEAYRVANVFGWCPDRNCGADIVGGEPHHADCKVSKAGAR